MSSSASSRDHKDHVANVLGLLEGPLEGEHFELVDVECNGIGTSVASVRVFVEFLPSHPIGGRIDLDGVAAATRVIDAQLEAHDIVPGTYTLEVSSPGLERPLRLPAHFRRYVGHQVSVKTKPGTPGERRIEGRLGDASLDADGAITVGDRVIAYADVDRARIVVQWGPPPKPGKVKKSERKPHPKALEAARLAALANPDAPLENELDEFEDDSRVDDELPADDFDDDDEFDDDDDDDDDPQLRDPQLRDPQLRDPQLRDPQLLRADDGDEDL